MTPVKTTGFLKTAVFSVGFLALVLAGLWAPKTASAATSTLRGTAWWGNTYQYVSFNCAEDIIGDLLDQPGNLYYPPEPYSFHFYATPCVSLIHAVLIDANDNFSGQAWNSVKGLITFNATATPPEDGFGFNSHCPHTCNLSNSCMACYNETDQKVYGWARVEGDGTWLRMDSGETLPVKLQSWDTLGNPVLPGHDILAGDFVGTATSALGNLSFNCESEGGGAGNCATRQYKVYIGNLAIGRLSAPNWSYGQACSGLARTAVLKWYLKSGQQTAYEIAVSSTNTLSTSTAVCWSGKKYSDSASQYIVPNSDPTCGALSYNTNYYWWIRLYDQDDQPTEWYQYNTNSLTDTDGNSDSNVQTFTTFKHEFPSPYYIWSPVDVLVGTNTLFTSQSQYFTNAAPSSAVPCVGASCLYLWTTSDAGAIIGNPTGATTTINFYTATGTSVTLRVTDVENYVCSTSSLLRINYDLPIWHEIKAQ